MNVQSFSCISPALNAEIQLPSRPFSTACRQLREHVMFWLDVADLLARNFWKQSALRNAQQMAPYFQFVIIVYYIFRSRNITCGLDTMRVCRGYKLPWWTARKWQQISITKSPGLRTRHAFHNFSVAYMALNNITSRHLSLTSLLSSNWKAPHNICNIL